MSDKTWDGYVIEKGAGVTLTADEYDVLLTADYVARMHLHGELIGMYVVVDTVIALINEDMENESETISDEETAILKEILKKMEPHKGKAIFLP